MKAIAKAPIAILEALRDFMRIEAAGGILLMGAAVAAMIVANTPFADGYFAAKASYIGPLTLSYWINDGLMALFFLLVGLEIKREFLEGQLSTPTARILPALAAGAGVAVPAIVFVMIAGGDPALVRGWAIPAATDIAFALGVLALLGSRAPASLKILLTAIAVIDDLVAVLIIALFYTAELALVPLGLAFAGIAVLILCNRAGVRHLGIYGIVGLAIWAAVLASGVHATLAGVAVALTIPLKPKPVHKAATQTPSATADESGGHSPLHRLEHGLHPWIAFGIIPLFGFFNAGVALGGMSGDALVSPLPLGIALGLLIGKQVGIFGAIFAAVRGGLSPMPEGAGWSHIVGLAFLCGIGFTMSLFIGGLAFDDPALQDLVRVGVLGGSIIAGLAGFAILFFAGRNEAKEPA
ncbi:Na+/H+ antiporter NhaA [Altericroceibacterium endophyticum]|uniref:Na(+)/H(+) antiporter NhaA n=1 Tax=Altericroceibacterium endophyticum TaxID=1808508 RepID=A0A6I4T8Y1_9SPHN|nr:Na+/H+ antiporter NhaA [Altericroceibacterium endophyticum]MXO67158.1 Na+/H+ antiporter NhaA [Altericroceibacterium endophyticum]